MQDMRNVKLAGESVILEFSAEDNPKKKKGKN